MHKILKGTNTRINKIYNNVFYIIPLTLQLYTFYNTFCTLSFKQKSNGLIICILICLANVKVSSFKGCVESVLLLTKNEYGTDGGLFLLEPFWQKYFHIASFSSVAFLFLFWIQHNTNYIGNKLETLQSVI